MSRHYQADLKFKFTASMEAADFLQFIHGCKRLPGCGDVWVPRMLRKRLRRPIGRFYRRMLRKTRQKVQ